MDEDPKKDKNITVNNPAKIQNNIVGGRLEEFDSCLVLAHFKGHGAGGFGGSLKQLSIGFASQAGKTNIHTAGVTTNWKEMNTYWAKQVDFTSSMGDAASTIVEYFRSKKGIAFINVLANISLYCDCSGDGAPKPRIKDIGILASTDPVAIDQASFDMIKTHTDEGTFELINRIKFLNGENTIHIAEQHGLGQREYNLIDVDGHDKKDDTDTEKRNLYIVIIVLSAVGLALVIALIVVCCRKKKQLDTNFEGISLVNKEE